MPLWHTHGWVRTLRWILGGFWILDGVLQGQPGLFGNGMERGVLGPAAAGQPPWFHGLLVSAMHWWAIAPNVFNAAAGLGQMVLGVLIISSSVRAARGGLIASIAWGGLVFVLGEGLGGLLTRGQSALTGLPGSALLYVALAVFLLRAPTSNILRRWLTWSVASYLGLTAFYALAASRPSQLAAAVRMAAANPAPSFTQGPLWNVALWAQHDVTILTGVVGLLPALLAVGWLRPQWSSWVFWPTLAWLLAVWWFGMDFGVLGGHGTDPNTAPVIAVMAWGVMAPMAARASASKEVGQFSAPINSSARERSRSELQT